MEPYRPYVDKIVFDILRDDPNADMTTEVKVKLLNIPILDVCIEGRRSPLMVAVSHTTSSLVKCFKGEIRKVAYPIM